MILPAAVLFCSYISVITPVLTCTQRQKAFNGGDRVSLHQPCRVRIASQWSQNFAWDHCVFKLLLFWNPCRCSMLVSCLKQLAGLQWPCKGQQDSCTAGLQLSPRCGSKVELGTFWEAGSHFTWRKFKMLSSKCRMNYKVSKTVQNKKRDNVSAGQTKLQCKL